ncbi:MAG TPA: hypothetical protein VF968_03350 [Actinomycetota bacterium]
MFDRQAAGEGAAAVFAFPLQIGAVSLGALHLYRAREGTLSVTDMSVEMLVLTAERAAPRLSRLLTEQAP